MLICACENKIKKKNFLFPVLSSAWFPAEERITATSVAQVRIATSHKYILQPSIGVNCNLPQVSIATSHQYIWQPAIFENCNLPLVYMATSQRCKLQPPIGVYCNQPKGIYCKYVLQPLSVKNQPSIFILYKPQLKRIEYILLSLAIAMEDIRLQVSLQCKRTTPYSNQIFQS